MKSLNYNNFINELKLKNKLCVPLGVTKENVLMEIDLEKYPNILINGYCGSGKSVFIKCLLATLLLKNNNDDLKLVIIDTKQVELHMFRKLPHLMFPIVHNGKEAMEVVSELINIAKDRIKQLKRKPVKAKTNHIVVIIEEYADLYCQCSHDINNLIEELCSLSKDACMNVIIATQRVQSLPLKIRNHIDMNICFACDKQQSHLVLKNNDAATLNGLGELIMRQTKRPLEKQINAKGLYITSQDIHKIIKQIVNED